MPLVRRFPEIFSSLTFPISEMGVGLGHIYIFSAGLSIA